MLSLSVFCLAMAIYHESRGEPDIGQVAVANVVLNRVSDPRFPADVCSVIEQKKQFSFDRRIPREIVAWNKSVYIARRVLQYNKSDPTGGSLHYHSDSIQVPWTKNMQPMRIGRHIFWLETKN